MYGKTVTVLVIIRVTGTFCYILLLCFFFFLFLFLWGGGGGEVEGGSKSVPSTTGLEALVSAANGGHKVMCTLLPCGLQTLGTSSQLF